MNIARAAAILLLQAVSAAYGQSAARDSVREAVSDALRRSVQSPSHEVQELERAYALASTYANRWGDSLPLREVARFTEWPRRKRVVKVQADSLRRAGIKAFGARGAAAAIVIWRRALARSMSIGDSVGAAPTLANIGAGFLQTGKLDSASRYLERARTIAEAVRHVRVQANATGELAGVSQRRGDLAGARALYLVALDLRERIGDSRGIAADYNNLGTLALELGEREMARGYFERALAINRADGRAEQAATNLVNLAGLLVMDGEFARADTLYREAVTVWRDREMWIEVADVLHDIGQLQLRRADYPSARISFQRALEVIDDAGDIEEAVMVRRALASVEMATGNLQRAVEILRRAQQLADSGGVSAAARAAVALARGDLALQLNAHGEADRFYRRAAVEYERASDLAGFADAQHGLGLLLLDRDELVRAASHFDVALRAQLTTGDKRSAALTRVAIGQAWRSRNDTARARRELTTAVTELDALADSIGSAFAVGELAALQAEWGFRAVAESLYRAALLHARGRAAPDVTWRLRSGLAEVLRERGAFELAATELQRAITDIASAASSLSIPERRSAYRADKVEPYLQLAMLEHRRGRAAAAFSASEQLRARETADLLAKGRVSPPDTSRELVEREQDLRRRIALLSHGAPVTQAGSLRLRGPDLAWSATSQEALTRAQEAYSELRIEIRERAPRYGQLVDPAPVTWHQVSSHLAPSQVFIEYLITDATSIAIVITRDTVATVELPASRRELARLVEFVRATLQPETQRTRMQDSLWRAPLSRLYSQLVDPIAASGLLDSATRLILVPHLELHYLPFAALIESESPRRFLIERFSVSYVPSAWALVWLAEQRPVRTAMGTSAFAPKPRELPASAGEAIGAARRDAPQRVFIGANASEDMLARVASSSRILHLAAYGVLNKQNPLFSYVELAPGGETDGRLEVHEVMGMRLSALLVVLSACQTALGSGFSADVPAGDDWISLTRAFLVAGAAQVAATLWSVRDRPTATLMDRFYDRMDDRGDAAEALAAAQRAMLKSNRNAHPFDWAAFVVVGHPGS